MKQIVLAFLLVSSVQAGDISKKQQEILHAIRQVESGNHQVVPDGDNGKAIGPYQIHKSYWEDGSKFGNLGGSYEDCRKPEYAKKVVVSYWKRYCPQALESGNYEILSKVHNGGPKGNLKQQTETYWKKIQNVLKTP